MARVSDKNPPNIYEETPLHRAAKNGHDRCIEGCRVLQFWILKKVNPDFISHYLTIQTPDSITVYYCTLANFKHPLVSVFLNILGGLTAQSNIWLHPLELRLVHYIDLLNSLLCNRRELEILLLPYYADAHTQHNKKFDWHQNGTMN